MRILVISFVLCLFACFTIDSKAQGDLQFNRVVHFTLNGSTPQSFTVPTNKVWKIVSAGAGYYSCYVFLRDGSGNNLAMLYTNDLNYRVHFPYWLPGGFSGDFYRTGNVSSGPMSTVSIIEFNVVP